MCGGGGRGVVCCACLCVCLYVQAGTHVHMGVEVRGQCQVSTFNKLYHIFFFEIDLSLNLQFTVWSGSSRMSLHILLQVRYRQALTNFRLKTDL